MNTIILIAVIALTVLSIPAFFVISKVKKEADQAQQTFLNQRQGRKDFEKAEIARIDLQIQARRERLRKKGGLMVATADF